MKLRSANTVKDFKEIVAKGEGLRKNLAGAGMCHLTEKPALQFIFYLAWVEALYPGSFPGLLRIYLNKLL